MTQPELSTPFVAAPLNQQAGTGTMRSSADIARDGRGTEAAKQAMLAQRQALLDGPVLAVMLKLLMTKFPLLAWVSPLPLTGSVRV